MFACDGAPPAVPDVVERKVPGNAEDPGPAPPFVALGRRRPRDAQEHFLRELSRVFMPDDAAQVPEHSVSMGGEQDVGVGHQWTLPVKNTGQRRSSQVCSPPQRFI
jgi:hypothetical protein